FKGFHNDEACLFLTKGYPTFLLSKFNVKRPIERSLIEYTENSSGQKSHFNDFSRHLQMFIFVIQNLPRNVSREAAKFVGKIVFQACKFRCKYTLFKFNLNKDLVYSGGDCIKKARHMSAPDFWVKYSYYFISSCRLMLGFQLD